MKTLNISIYAIESKTNSKGLSPLYAKISLPLKSAIRISLSESVNLKRWQSTDQFRKTKDYDEREQRIKLDGYIQRLYDIDEQFQETNKPYTIEMVKKAFLKKANDDVQEYTLLKAYTEYKNWFDAKVKKGKLSENTFKKYNSMKLKLDDYLKEIGEKDILLTQVDDDFCKQFHGFIQDEGVGLNSANKYIFALRRIITVAVDEWKWLKDSPIRKMKFTWDETDPTSLTIEEVQRIVNKDFTGRKAISKVKDLYLFMIVTGLAYTDLRLLEKDDVRQVNGEFVIEKFRTKTKKYKSRANIVLTQDALNIIKKYEKEMRDSDRLLPVTNNADFNLHLKTIGAECKIDKNLTCHVARHSAGVISAMLGFSTREIAAMLGQKSERMANHYAAIAKTNLSQPMKKFEGLISAQPKKKAKLRVA